MVHSGLWRVGNKVIFINFLYMHSVHRNPNLRTPYPVFHHLLHQTSPVADGKTLSFLITLTTFARPTIRCQTLLVTFHPSNGVIPEHLRDLSINNRSIVLLLSPNVIPDESQDNDATSNDDTVVHRTRRHRRRRRPNTPEDDEDHIYASVSVVDDAEPAFEMPWAPDEGSLSNVERRFFLDDLLVFGLFAHGYTFQSATVRLDIALDAVVEEESGR
ncbi:hypothetical protein M8818_003794 [Zalaria obscura]|uniref:Uncharacterized protein n=1 Tax=Zalaria obscura TaxID=2024903 RepID=A0ACC3SDF2_9PEZI